MDHVFTLRERFDWRKEDDVGNIQRPVQRLGLVEDENRRSKRVSYFELVLQARVLFVTVVS